MNAYTAIISARFRMLLQYRAAALAGVVTQVFWGLVKLMVLYGFYRSTKSVQPMTFADIVGYTWLGQAFLGLQPWSSDGEVASQIRSGAIAYELARPVDLYGLWYARALGMRMAVPLMRCIPILLLAGVILPLVGAGDWALRPPASWEAAGGFALTLFGTLLLSCAITCLYSISLLWTVGGDGVTPLLSVGVLLFSGMIVPLPLFPDWLKPLLYSLPFAGLADTPFRVYTGNYSAMAALPLFAHQALWTIALVLLGRWLVRRAMHRVVVQGG